MTHTMLLLWDVLGVQIEALLVEIAKDELAEDVSIVAVENASAIVAKDPNSVAAEDGSSVAAEDVTSGLEGLQAGRSHLLVLECLQ